MRYNQIKQCFETDDGRYMTLERVQTIVSFQSAQIDWMRRKLATDRVRIEIELAEIRRRRENLERFFLIVSGVLFFKAAVRELACFWRWAWARNHVETFVVMMACWSAGRSLFGFEMGDLSFKRYVFTWMIYGLVSLVVVVYRHVRVKTDYEHLSARVV